MYQSSLRIKPSLNDGNNVKKILINFIYIHKLGLILCIYIHGKLVISNDQACAEDLGTTHTDGMLATILQFIRR